jgi:hypothetical protein
MFSMDRLLLITLRVRFDLLKTLLQFFISRNTLCSRFCRVVKRSSIASSITKLKRKTSFERQFRGIACEAIVVFWVTVVRLEPDRGFAHADFLAGFLTN